MFFVLAFNKFSIAKLRFKYLKHHLALSSFLPLFPSSTPLGLSADKGKKAFAADLKTIYHASNEEQARVALDRVNDKWSPKYPNAMKRWYDNWDAISPIFKAISHKHKIDKKHHFMPKLIR